MIRIAHSMAFNVRTPARLIIYVDLITIDHAISDKNRITYLPYPNGRTVIDIDCLMSLCFKMYVLKGKQVPTYFNQCYFLRLDISR